MGAPALKRCPVPARLVGFGALAVCLLALAPAGAGAATHSFYDTTPLFPTGGALTEGPANEYPSTIPVTGVPGTVTGVKVTLFGFGSANADDADVVLTGPNGAKVMLLSDACGDQGTRGDTWTFDDAAPTFVSNNGPCQQFEEASFKPSNYLGNDGTNDDLSVALGGPPPPYVNSLSSLAGGSPSGNWNLFMFDDNPGFFGFEIDGWGLTLEVQPPPTTPASPSAGPANTAKPQLSGKAKAGKTLTCASGAWTGSPSFAYGWLRNGDPIPGEASTTLKLKRKDARKAVQCEVTATNAGGTATEQSKPVVPKKPKRRR